MTYTCSGVPGCAGGYVLGILAAYENRAFWHGNLENRIGKLVLMTESTVSNCLSSDPLGIPVNM